MAEMRKYPLSSARESFLIVPVQFVSTVFLYPLFIFLFFIMASAPALPQQTEDVLPDSATLEDCLAYAMDHQPLVKQMKLDEAISRQDIRIAFSDWLPQVTSSADYQHYLKQPVIFLPNFNDPAGPRTEITTGVKNNSTINFSASQVLFNSDVYLAARTSRYYRLRSEQNTRDALIGLVADISKAYYSVLGAGQQVKIIREDIERISRNLKDAYARYQTGASDNIDYKRATISLNNAKAQLISAGESLKSSKTNLKRLIAYPEDRSLALKSDFSSMEKDIDIEPLQVPDYSERIEYQLLKTNLQLQKAMVDYYRFGFLPTLSGYADYNLTYHSDKFSDLYNRAFPNSLFGLTLNFPIFQGARRIENLKKASLNYERLALDTINLRDQMNTEYVSAIGSYKSYIAAYRSTSENVNIAGEVYQTVKSQYDQGIKSYLEVIVSETDLRTAQINNINALVMVLSSRVDVERALGRISINY